MHGLRRELMLSQVAALGLPCTTLELPESPDMKEYEAEMNRVMSSFKNDGFSVSAFGDIFLEDLRRYREEKLAAAGFAAVFPLWKRDTRELMHEFIDLGFRAVVVCVNLRHLGEDFAGRELDRSFLADLPTNVDPCGENGEFHTFCYAGPIFQKSIDFVRGEIVIREYPSPQDSGKYRFAFQDLKAQ